MWGAPSGNPVFSADMAGGGRVAVSAVAGAEPGRGEPAFIGGRRPRGACSVQPALRPPPVPPSAPRHSSRERRSLSVLSDSSPPSSGTLYALGTALVAVRTGGTLWRLHRQSLARSAV